MSKRKSSNVTIKDVARRAKVSPITASRALSGSEKVRPETRQIVTEAAQDLGYIPNFAASMLNSNVSKMIAVIVPNLANSIFATTLQEISEGVRKAGYQLLVGCSDYSLEREEELVRTFLSRGTDAIVLTGHLHTDATRSMFHQAQTPVVEMWSVSDTPLGISIGVSNYDAAVMATEYLVSIGRRRIAYIGGDISGNDRAQARIAGYKFALEEAGMVFDPDLVVTGPFDFDTGAKAVKHLSTFTPSVDAIFAASDIIALGALNECLQNDIAVPGQMAICGFDDARIAQVMRPAMTTVKFPRREIGQRVAAALLTLLSGSDPEEHVVKVGFSLVIRDTA